MFEKKSAQDVTGPGAFPLRPRRGLNPEVTSRWWYHKMTCKSKRRLYDFVCNNNGRNIAFNLLSLILMDFWDDDLLIQMTFASTC